MVRKIRNNYYLNRAEVVEYMMAAYPLLWCFTRWSGGSISVSFCSKSGKKNVFGITPLKIKNSACVYLCKKEIDFALLNVS
jgi:hypothetical protein